VLDHSGDQSIAISTDGTVLAVTSSDGLVRLWDLPGAQLKVRLRAEAIAHAVALAPDGSSVAVACEGGVVRSWRVSHGHERVFDPEKLLKEDNMALIALSPNGRIVAVAGSGPERCEVILWDLIDERRQVIFK